MSREQRKKPIIKGENTKNFLEYEEKINETLKKQNKINKELSILEEFILERKLSKHESDLFYYAFSLGYNFAKENK